MVKLFFNLYYLVSCANGLYSMTMREREITDRDLIAAENLRRIWNEKKKISGLTLEKAGELLGISHSALSQYMNAKLPIGVDFLLRISELLGVEPKEIRPDFRWNLHFSSNDNFSSETLDIARYYDRLSPDARKVFYVALKSVSECGI